MVVSMLVTAIYNVVDTYFVSGLGTQQAGAVSVAFPLSLIFSGIGLTFGVGAGSYISRLLGKKQMEKAHRTASTAMFTSVIVSLTVAVVLFLALTPALHFMGATSSIMPFAEKYARIFLVSLVFSAINVAAGNLAVAQGATTISLIAMLTGAVLNMVLGLIMELPPYHKPYWKSLFGSVFSKVGSVLKRALSIICRIRTFIEPVTMFFGLPYGFGSNRTVGNFFVTVQPSHSQKGEF